MGGAEEDVDRIARLAAEPRDEPRPAAMGTEEQDVEAERSMDPRETLPEPQRLEALPRRRVSGLRVTPECGDERLVLRAGRGDAGQIVVGQPDQGRLQGCREGEVVLRQQRGPARGHEVENGDVLADLEPVLTR